jgi:hypothetical protein
VKDDVDNGDQPAGYCCLGVLARVKGIDRRRLNPHGTLSGIETSPGKSLWVGIVGSDQLKLEQKLISLNDSGDYDFNRIAAWIVKNL